MYLSFSTGAGELVSGTFCGTMVFSFILPHDRLSTLAELGVRSSWSYPKLSFRLKSEPKLDYGKRASTVG